MIKIQFSKDFEADYRAYKEKLLGLESSQKEIPIIEHKTNGQPRCFIEDGSGYLQFGRHTKKILISKSTSQPYKLLSLMIDPLDTARVTDVVFESIRLEKHKSDSRLNDLNKAVQRKVELIDNVITELQKEGKLGNKLYFSWDSNMKRSLRLKYRG